MGAEPTPFEVYAQGMLLHGTKAQLEPGDLGTPTRSFRTREPVRVVGELAGWTGHAAEVVQARRRALADLVRRGTAVIYD